MKKIINGAAVFPAAPAALRRLRPATAKQAPPRGPTGQRRVHDAVGPGHDRPHGLPPGRVLHANALAKKENGAITSTGRQGNLRGIRPRLGDRRDRARRALPGRRGPARHHHRQPARGHHAAGRRRRHPGWWCSESRMLNATWDSENNTMTNPAAVTAATA